MQIKQVIKSWASLAFTQFGAEDIGVGHGEAGTSTRNSSIFFWFLPPSWALSLLTVSATLRIPLLFIHTAQLTVLALCCFCCGFQETQKLKKKKKGKLLYIIDYQNLYSSYFLSFNVFCSKGKLSVPQTLTPFLATMPKIAPSPPIIRTLVLEKALESPLDCKEIQPVHPKGDQSWVFIRRTDA